MTQSYDELLAKAAASIESKKPKITSLVYRIDSIFSFVTVEPGGTYRYRMQTTVIHDASIFKDRGFLAVPSDLAFFNEERGPVGSRWHRLKVCLYVIIPPTRGQLISAERFYELFKSSEIDMPASNRLLSDMPASNRLLRSGGHSSQEYALFVPYNLNSIKRANLKPEAFSID